jgi:hypothetical protein
MAPIDDLVKEFDNEGACYARRLPKYGIYLSALRTAVAGFIRGGPIEDIVPLEVRTLQEKLTDMNKIHISIHSREFDDDYTALYQALEDMGYCPFNNSSRNGG